MLYTLFRLCLCGKWECRNGYYTSDRGDQPIRGKFVLKVELFFLGFQATICFTRYSDCDCACAGKWECICGYYTRDRGYQPI